MTLSSVVIRRPWRTGGLILLSTGCNIGILTLLTLNDFDRRPRARPIQPPLYLEIEPRPSLPTERSLAADIPPRPKAGALDQSLTSSASLPVPLAVAPAVVETERSDIDPLWRVEPKAGRLALPASCDAPLRLTPDERRRCELRWSRRGETARALTGSGDAARDARFARQGARRLAAWEAQRAEPPLGDPPCERPNPVAGCTGVNIQVELFSSRDGLLPNLRKRRE